MRRWVVAGAIVAAAVACKNERTESSPAPPSTAPPSQPNAATADETAQPTSTAPAFDPENEYAPDVVVLGVDTTVVPGASAPPPPPPDPFAPAVDAVRATALSCFAPLPPGTYASTVVVRVTPAGTPVDVQVDPGNVQDPAVLGCLRQAGEGRTYPSSPDGRTLRVYVRVAG